MAEVVLESGSVKLTERNKAEDGVILRPGEMGRVSRQSGIEVRHVDLQLYTTWKDKYMNIESQKMENVMFMLSKRYHTRLLPAIHNLVFVHSTRKRIDALKDELESSMPIRFIMNREFCRPVVIPDAQMRSFILVAGSHEEAILYVEPAELHLAKGQKVRITGGVFEGVIGEFVRIRHDRRVVVNIEGVMAVATTFISPSLVEPVE